MRLRLNAEPMETVHVSPSVALGWCPPNLVLAFFRTHVGKADVQRLTDALKTYSQECDERLHLVALLDAERLTLSKRGREEIFNAMRIGESFMASWAAVVRGEGFRSRSLVRSRPALSSCVGGFP
ncbi:MAG: hypothetical protein AAF654_07915 [Myxococcota bacterium]